MNVAILADSTTASTEAKTIAAALEKHEHQVEVLDVDSDIVATLQTKRPDICCIAPGTKGSHGALQEILELVRIPYLGSNAQAISLSADSKLSMFSMHRFAEASEEEVTVESLTSFSLSSEMLSGNKEALAALCEDRIPGGYPIEVMPLGKASILSNNKQELLAAFDTCEQSGCVVRQWIEGVRLSVAVIGTGWDAHVLPPVEITEEEFIAPVRLNSLSGDESVAQAIRSEVERCAFELCLSLGLRDYGLVHMIWDGAQVRVLGIEALPSMESGTVFGKACKAAGLSLGGVLDRLVSL